MVRSQKNITIFQAIAGYLDVIKRARSQNTLNFFANVLEENAPHYSSVILSPLW
jgi:hypothetical protein